MMHRDLTISEHALFSILEDNKLTSSEKLQHLDKVFQQSNEIKKIVQDICDSIQSRGFTIPRLISQSEININIKKYKNYTNETLIALAAKNGDAKCVAALLDLKADINLCTIQQDHYQTYCNPYDANPLMLAAKNGRLECVTLLLERKANIERPTDLNGTPHALGLAIEYNRVDCAKALILAKADVNQEYYGCKPVLQIAVRKSYIDCVKLLIESRANITENILDIAIKTKNIEITKYFRNSFFAMMNESTSMCSDVEGIVADYIGLELPDKKNNHEIADEEVLNSLSHKTI